MSVSWIRIPAISLVVALILVAAFYGVERLRLRLESGQVEVIESKAPPVFNDRFVFLAPGIVPKAAKSVPESTLVDDDEIIGIVVGQRSRAYRLKDMEDRMRHVVNDVVNEIPITLTYCNVNRCIRGFTANRGRGPLAISQSGLKGSRMVIRVDGIDYLQETAEPLVPGSKPLEFANYPVSRTTWKAWREAHPETEVIELRPALLKK